jgi:hypothetical protein
MRNFILTTVLVLLFASPAGAWGICTTIEWRSLKQIDCSEVEIDGGKVFVIVYGRGILDLLNARGSDRADMIKGLCDDGATLVREIDGATSILNVCS